MKWLSTKNKFGETDPFCIQSDCGKYTIAKYVSAGREMYGAHFGKECLLMDEDPKAAKQACERHANPIPEMDFASYSEAQR